MFKVSLRTAQSVSGWLQVNQAMSQCVEGSGRPGVRNGYLCVLVAETAHEDLGGGLEGM